MRQTCSLPLTHVSYIYIYIYIYTCVCLCVIIFIRSVFIYNYTVMWYINPQLLASCISSYLSLLVFQCKFPTLLVITGMWLCSFQAETLVLENMCKHKF